MTRASDEAAVARVTEYVRQRSLKHVTGIDMEEISGIMFDPDLDYMAKLNLSDLKVLLRLVAAGQAEKMQVNRARAWARQADGAFQHVEVDT